MVIINSIQIFNKILRLFSFRVVACVFFVLYKRSSSRKIKQFRRCQFQSALEILRPNLSSPVGRDEGVYGWDDGDDDDAVE